MSRERSNDNESLGDAIKTIMGNEQGGSMQYIPIHTLSMDDLPEEGAVVLFFDHKTHFGMFDELFTTSGQVEYQYDEDIADSLEEALSAGGFISLGYSEDDMAIPITINGEWVDEGVKWMYEHEYLPVLDENSFPFQVFSYFQLGLKEGWCTLLSTDQETLKMADSEAESEYREIDYVTYKVLFNSKVFSLDWVVVEGEYSFKSFEIDGEVKGE